jgi:YidC/Oxa1 family membrane protein insertase
LKPFVDLISPAMLWLLGSFEKLTGNWGVAIILLTVVVRCLMLPLSIKQAISTAKMQALQPELQALQRKYADRKEELAKATMELYSKNGVNMFGGCLLVLPQMPVFIALYQALNHTVDLRLAPFLYIKNLAAPDSLFALPFVVPFLGWTEFNLLPLLSMSLFILQQKLFMPPPTSEEQAMQYRMMYIMSVVMGFLFYRMPAGLCLYFICSSLWGVTERLLLPRVFPATKPASHPPITASIAEPKSAASATNAASAATAATTNGAAEPEKKSTWFGRVMESVEKVQKAAEAEQQARRKRHRHKKR